MSEGQASTGVAARGGGSEAVGAESAALRACAGTCALPTHSQGRTPPDALRHPCPYRPAVKPLQFHLHTASEHLVNGELAPVELHIVTAGGWG